MLYSDQVGAEEDFSAGHRSGQKKSQQAVKRALQGDHLWHIMRLHLRRPESEFSQGRGLHIATHSKVSR